MAMESQLVSLALSQPHPPTPSLSVPPNKHLVTYPHEGMGNAPEEALPCIDWRLALQRAANQAPLARELLQLLLNSLPPVAQQVEQLLQGAEPLEILNWIHKLHGGALYSGVPRLSALCFTLESQLRQGTPPHALIPEWQALLDEFTAIEQAAVHWLA